MGMLIQMTPRFPLCQQRKEWQTGVLAYGHFEQFCCGQHLLLFCAGIGLLGAAVVSDDFE
jgi:hypothetical protein